MGRRRKRLGLLGLIIFPFIIMGGLLKLSDSIHTSRKRRGGVMCGPGGSKKRK